MADTTIKYSKTENGTTTNVFEHFEPHHYGEPAIPAELYFLGVDGNGYQQYTDDNGYGFKEVNAVDSKSNQLYKKNNNPIRGCAKGTVVKAHEIARGQYDTEIWVDGNKTYYKDSNGDPIELKDSATGVQLLRVGVAIIGGGGACGDCKTEDWKNECHTFDTTMPGGGGGGGATVWGIINLELASTENKYSITVGAGGTTKSASGKDTELSHTSAGTLAKAGGGGGGTAGKKSGAGGGTGGLGSDSDDGNIYFIWMNKRDGKKGGYYAEVNTGSEDQYIGSAVEANNFEITFIPDHSKLNGGSNTHTGVGATVKEIANAKGNLYLAVPGGNSFGQGGYPNGTGSLMLPSWGGGGMSWTHNDNTPETIWASDANSFKENSDKARCGANGGWILFY